MAVLLTLCLLLGCVPAVFAADQTKELELQQTPVSISPENENVETDAADEPAPEETVRVIIRFRSDSLTGHGYSTRGLGSNAAALAYSDRLQKEQRTQIKAISVELGVTLPVRYQFTIGVNGVATSVPYGEVEAIRAMDGVESVYVENQYEPDVDEPNTSTAGTMIGSYNAWADGYTGAGSRVAIIDTGLDIDHPSFDESAFLYGLERSAARFGKQVSDYDLMTEEDITKVLPRLHASERMSGLTADELYRTVKIPYAFNYIDEDLDVTHDNDAQGDHGTHVAGIATANRYVENADGTYTEIEQPQAAACVFDYRTGELKAIVGGRYKPTTRKTLNRASGMTMPVGSSIKPLSVYAPALESGVISPASAFDDYPVQLLSGKAWPLNNPQTYRGRMTVAAALEVSSNPVAVRTLQNLGVKNSFQFMEEKFHIDLEDGRTVNGQVMNDLGASQLALGGLTDGVSVVDMAAAYSVFPRNGLYVEPRTYTKVTRVLDDGTEEVLAGQYSESARGGSLRGDHLVY